MATEKLLTFELTPDGQHLEIHCDRAGLRAMVAALDALASGQSLPDHDDWRTPAWAGNELTEKKQGSKNSLINHVKISLWR